MTFEKISLSVLLADATLVHYLGNASLSAARKGGTFIATNRVASKELRRYGIVLPKGGMILPNENPEALKNTVEAYYRQKWAREADKRRKEEEEKKARQDIENQKIKVFLAKVLSTLETLPPEQAVAIFHTALPAPTQYVNETSKENFAREWTASIPPLGEAGRDETTGFSWAVVPVGFRISFGDRCMGYSFASISFEAYLLSNPLEQMMGVAPFEVRKLPIAKRIFVGRLHCADFSPHSGPWMGGHRE